MMVGMDFPESISSRYFIIEATYVLICMNQFSRFVWAKRYANADLAAVHDIWMEHLMPIYNFPESLDHGSHVTGSEVTTLFESHGTS